MSQESIRRQIKLHTEQAFSRPIHPHLFRDCAATSVAIHDPEHVRYTAQILGHHSLASSQKYYNQSHMLEAGRRHQATIGHLRQALNQETGGPVMPAAIYARYSSDNQRDASIEDQVRICEQRIEAEDWGLVETYSDHALSGASAHRPSYQQMLTDARTGRFDILVAEALDRLSRDQEDIAGLYKQLTFAGVKLVTLAEGEINELHVGLKGTMNALFLKDLAAKTRRGLEGRVRQGKAAGGLSFGYDVLRETDGAGEPLRGGREINENEARLVRRIFEDFSRGQSPRAIAKALNDEGIPGPRGRPWRDTTIRGHVTRGTGILRNELYIGRLVWNRQRYVKDPATGKRLARPNPKSNWVVEEVPQLRIIDQELWDCVQSRLAGIRNSERVSKARKTEFLEASPGQTPSDRSHHLRRMRRSHDRRRQGLPRL